jgi:hypothetical protein
MSLSISGLVVYITGILFTFRNKFFRFFTVFSGFIVFILLLQSRGVVDVTAIDRFVFWKIGFETWLNDLSSLEKFFSLKISPLNSQYNSILSFYELGKDNIEYPSTLHSYIIRLILVYGIVGTIIILSYLYKILNISNLNVKNFIFLAAFFSSISISTFGNVFFLASVFLITYYGNHNLKQSKIIE